MRKWVFTLILLPALAASAARPRWEAVDVPRAYIEQIDVDGFDIAASEGCIYVTTRRPVTVKVFTILGQLITQDTLGAGSHRLKMPSKGIYIIKIGDATRRVTI